MWTRLRDTLHAYLPANFHDPVGLALRLVKTGDRAALLAMGTTAAGVLLTPLDLMLLPLEHAFYRSAPPPRGPLILVCGPPRSGTTVVAQTLMRNLDLGYLNNLTAAFPRSPVAANRLLGRFIGPPRLSYRSYYGKSDHLSGPNDALYIWDRWLGSDRTRIPDRLDPADARRMERFFAAWERLERRPVVNKNNSLNTCAKLVAKAMPNACFLCLERDPLYLAQALLIARTEIQGDEHVPYGVHVPGSRPDEDPVDSVCRQVVFFERMAKEQEQALGPDRFWRVSYERFCQDPVHLLRRVSERILGRPLDEGTLDPDLKGFEPSRKVKLPAETFQRLEATLDRMRAEAGLPARGEGGAPARPGAAGSSGPGELSGGVA